MDAGNPGNDGFDKNGNPIRVEDYSVVKSGNAVCITETTVAGHATNEAQKTSMVSNPTPRSSDIILATADKVVSSKIEGGVPPKFDIFANIARAKKMSAFDFYNAVRNHGLWDYKQQGSMYQDFGNWNYGLTGRAFGWSRDILGRMAGYAQQKAGTSRPEWGNPLGGYPYGDDPADEAVISSGAYFYNLAF